MMALKVIYDLLMFHGLKAFMDNSAAASEASTGFNDAASSAGSALDSEANYRQVGAQKKPFFG